MTKDTKAKPTDHSPEYDAKIEHQGFEKAQVVSEGSDYFEDAETYKEAAELYVYGDPRYSYGYFDDRETSNEATEFYDSGDESPTSVTEYPATDYKNASRRGSLDRHSKYGAFRITVAFSRQYTSDRPTRNANCGSRYHNSKFGAFRITVAFSRQYTSHRLTRNLCCRLDVSYVISKEKAGQKRRSRPLPEPQRTSTKRKAKELLCSCLVMKDSRTARSLLSIPLGNMIPGGIKICLM